MHKQRQEGSTASSQVGQFRSWDFPIVQFRLNFDQQGFSKREKAAEDQYVQNREREAYKKAHAELKAQREKMEKEGVSSALLHFSQ